MRHYTRRYRAQQAAGRQGAHVAPDEVLPQGKMTAQLQRTIFVVVSMLSGGAVPPFLAA